MMKTAQALSRQSGVKAVRSGAKLARAPARRGAGAAAASMTTTTHWELDQGELQPRVHESAWVAHNATVVGDVEIGEESSIWFNSVLRGDRDLIKIGKRTNIQDGSVLHTDAGVQLVIADGCTIGHMVMLHGCTIGPNTLIGIGSTVLNNAKIGANCLIGAGALITEGREIPDGSLVMGTNKIVRSLTEEEIAGLRRSAAGYVQNSRRYAATLRPAL